MDKKELMQKIRALRDETGISFMEIRKALEAANGDMDEARKILRQRGIQIAAKKAHREAREGLIGAYIHFSGRLGSLVEVNCETDFVARTPEFKQLVDEIALQVAGMMPRYIRREDVPESEIQRLRTEFEETIAGDIPEAHREQAWQRYLERFYSETCLLEQPLIRDQSRTVRDLVTEAITKLGENIVIRRFIRFELGEDADT